MADREQGKASAYGKIIAKAWRDPAFKAKLLADPQGTLRQAGVSIPAGVTVKVVGGNGAATAYATTTDLVTRDTTFIPAQ